MVIEGEGIGGKAEERRDVGSRGVLAVVRLGVDLRSCRRTDKPVRSSVDVRRGCWGRWGEPEKIEDSGG